MEMYHTSPAKIEAITRTGLFDDCLFFSVDGEYAMGEVGAVYTLNVADDKIISVSDLDDEATISHIAKVLECDEETAEALLADELQAFEVTGDCEDGWFIQAQQGAAAKNMGFEAAEGTDEQGTVYIVPMIGRENDLVLAA